MVIVIALVVFVPMLVETSWAMRNERRQRARGGFEPADDVYSLIRVAYPAAFLAMLGEDVIRGGPSTLAVTAGLTLFVFAKALKWWAILTLGPAWTFRVIVVPGAPLAGGGPYRFVRHPNYVGVVGELVGAALMTHAVATGPLATLAFCALLMRRIAAEERALAGSRDSR